MHVNRINNMGFGGGIVISARKNAANTYLYNQVADIVKENHISAIFSNLEISFSSTTKKALSQLRKLGIKYMSK